MVTWFQVENDRVLLPRSGLAAAVPELPLEDRRGQRCSSPIATAREPRPVVQRRHDRVVDESSVNGAGEKADLSNTRET